MTIIIIVIAMRKMTIIMIVIIRRSADQAEPRRTSEVQFALVSAHQTSAMPFLKVDFDDMYISDNFHKDLDDLVADASID